MTSGISKEADPRVVLDQLLEKLAAVEHERWSHWQRYMHEKGKRQPDGSLLLPAELVARWNAQMNTPYAALTEEMKESDREQVRRYLPLIADTLTCNRSHTPYYNGEGR
jgi:hypothetical protein